MTLERAALPEASGSSGPVSLDLVHFYWESLFLLMPGHGTEAPGETKDAS